MSREYIKISTPRILPNLVSELKEISDEVWRSLIFYHLLEFYKSHDVTEIKNVIQNERSKARPRIEDEISKYIRRSLGNSRKFDLNGFIVIGENSNDENISGFYDITIAHSFWKAKFHLECKNLNESPSLINKYVFYYREKEVVDGGVYRYFNGKYAQSEDFGGMLGYVLDGDIITIKNKICKKLEEKYDITPEGDLINIVDSSIENNDFTFESLHKRLSSKFTIYHILFMMN